MNKLAPTKANLLKSKEQLKLMIQGYDILDKKRKVLFQMYRQKIDEKNKFKDEVNKVIKEVEHSIKVAVVSIGKESLKEIAQSIPIDDSLIVKEKEIMQTKIPEIIFNNDKLKLSYSFQETGILFDKAVFSLNELKSKVFKLAQLETTINNINREIAKTTKKVNSLEKIQIPNLKSIIKDISSQIEEKEREEFSKTKIVKTKKQKVSL